MLYVLLIKLYIDKYLATSPLYDYLIVEREVNKDISLFIQKKTNQKNINILKIKYKCN